jgi:hypothetical protein
LANPTRESWRPVTTHSRPPAMRYNQSMGSLSVRITSAPPGDAPLWVREAWIGLVLPVAKCDGPVVALTFGVLSGRSNSVASTLKGLLLGQAKVAKGYAIEAATAVDLLDAANREAADWWRRETPHLLKPKCNFVFQNEVCEEVRDER